MPRLHQSLDLKQHGVPCVHLSGRVALCALYGVIEAVLAREEGRRLCRYVYVKSTGGGETKSDAVFDLKLLNTSG